MSIIERRRVTYPPDAYCERCGSLDVGPTASRSARKHTVETGHETYVDAYRETRFLLHGGDK